VIILLSAGEDSEPLEHIKEAVADGKRLAGDVTVLAFGLNIGQQSICFNLTGCYYKYILAEFNYEKNVHITMVVRCGRPLCFTRVLSF